MNTVITWDNLRVGLPLATKDGMRYSNGFVYKFNKEDGRVTVITDWGNSIDSTIEEVNIFYKIPTTMAEFPDYPVESPADRLKEQIEKLNLTLHQINNREI